MSLARGQAAKSCVRASFSLTNSHEDFPVRHFLCSCSGDVWCVLRVSDGGRGRGAAVLVHREEKSQKETLLEARPGSKSSHARPHLGNSVGPRERRLLPRRSQRQMGRRYCRGAPKIPVVARYRRFRQARRANSSETWPGLRHRRSFRSPGSSTGFFLWSDFAALLIPGVPYGNAILFGVRIEFRVRYFLERFDRRYWFRSEIVRHPKQFAALGPKQIPTCFIERWC
jgi:hypothetical protein